MTVFQRISDPILATSLYNCLTYLVVGGAPGLSGSKGEWNMRKHLALISGGRCHFDFTRFRHRDYALTIIKERKIH